jgi:hypothetical protein
MKKFVAIYLGSAEGLAEWKATDDEKRKERENAGMEGWMKWAKDNEASIVDLGSPLGKTKRIDAKGISDTKNEITAYTIVQAESYEAAAELFSSAFYDLPGPVGRGHATENVNRELGHLHASRKRAVYRARPCS